MSLQSNILREPKSIKRLENTMNEDLVCPRFQSLASCVTARDTIPEDAFTGRTASVKAPWHCTSGSQVRLLLKLLKIITRLMLSGVLRGGFLLKSM